MSSKAYNQYCPIALAAEIVAERWTPLVLRGLFCGATRFNDIRASVPRMSTALLSQRLKELERANIIERIETKGGRASEYRLTLAGQELFPVLDRMGAWAQKWLRRDITRKENLDPDVLMWDIRHAVLEAGIAADKRRVVRFHLTDMAPAKRFYWLVFEPGEIDVCVKDPGFEVDLWIASRLRSLIEVWLGHVSVANAVKDGLIELDGARKEIAAFRNWFVLSHFAQAGAEQTKALRKAQRA